MSGPYWFEVAVVFGITALGNIFMGHWEERTPKWRRALKPFLLSALAIALSAGLGRAYFFGFLGLMLASVVAVHAWWLPRHGINGWTCEPKEKYYALRRWKWPPERF